MISRKPVFKLKAPVVREPVLHRQIADALRLEIAPPGRISRLGVCWFSIDVAAYSGSAPGIRTGRGVVAGIPDCCVLYRGCAHWIEIKAEDGRLSDAQCEVGAAILLAGAHFGVARSVEEVLELLDCWEIPRAQRTHVARAAAT